MDLIARLDAGDPRALPRLLTLVENADPAGLAALDALYPRTGAAHIVGVTGPPGSGKSTLIAALAERLREADSHVAVLAVDPSSPVSGGAVLGDRVRMMARHGDPGLFVRSMASRGRVGGLGPAAARAVHLLDAAGFPVVLVETVGSGQDAVDIATLAQTVVVVQVPGFGDGVQAIKAGQLEIGDILVVNKSDLPGAEEVLRTLRAYARATADGWERPILPVTAATGDGLDELLAAIVAHASHLRQGTGWDDRRRGAAAAEILAGLRDALERRLARLARDDGFADLVAEVADRARTPSAAIGDLLAAMGDGRDEHPAETPAPAPG